MKYDVVNLGEVLIDLTQTGMEGGLPRYAANPGGAPPMRRRPAPGWDVNGLHRTGGKGRLRPAAPGPSQPSLRWKRWGETERQRRQEDEDSKKTPRSGKLRGILFGLRGEAQSPSLSGSGSTTMRT